MAQELSFTFSIIYLVVFYIYLSFSIFACRFVSCFYYADFFYFLCCLLVTLNYTVLSNKFLF